MPNPERSGLKFNARGVNLVDPIDALPPGDYPYLNNVHTVQDGVLDPRPGQQGLSFIGGNVNSAKALQNIVPDGGQSLLLAGVGNSLYSITPNGLIVSNLGNGYSGNPLSMVRFRPDQSPDPWMYIANDNKMVKANAVGIGTVRNVGIVPPALDPYAEIVTDAHAIVNKFDTTFGWVATGNAGGITEFNRAVAGTTVGYIIYDSPALPNEFATISPSNGTASYYWLRPGMQIVVGGLLAYVKQVTPPINDTTVSAIRYDTGTSGLCTIVLAIGTQGIQHNSMLVLDNGSFQEPIRVISFSQAPDGSCSIRTSTTASWFSGVTVHGEISFRCYIQQGITAGASIAAYCLSFALAGAGTGQITSAGSLNVAACAPGNRPLQPDDYVHISVWIDNPAALSFGKLLIDVDATTNDFTQNYYSAQINPSNFQLSAATNVLTVAGTALTNNLISNSNVPYTTADAFTTVGSDVVGQNVVSMPTTSYLSSGDGVWAEIWMRVSDMQRVGTDTSRSLATVKAIAVSFTTSATVNASVSSWWMGGCYGPDVPLGSPVGMEFRYRYRDSRTGAKSVPSPATRYQLFPLREAIALRAVQSGDPQVDTIDYEVFDPNLQVLGQPAVWAYIGSQPNAQAGNGFAFQQSSQAIANNPPLETNTFQPFPTLLPPLIGTCNVIGTNVQYATGSVFPLNLIPGTVIQINGVAYQTFGAPPNVQTITLTSSAGVQFAVPFAIYSPVVFGTPLPVLFGPLEGSTAPIVFGLGDPNNPGFLYWLNPDDPDSADSANYIEITDPSEPLLDGCVWNGYVFVASANKLYLCSPNVGGNSISFTPIQIPAASGVWKRYTMVAAIDGVYYVGRDGIYRATPYAGAEMVSRDLWPLFPHEGQTANIGSLNGYALVNMNANMRLTTADSDIYFDHQDLLGTQHTWRFNPKNPNPGWWYYTYAHPANFHYWGEGGFQGKLIQGTADGFVMTQNGIIDNDALFTCSVQTPCMNQGDTRAQKLYVQVATDIIGSAVLSLFFNYNEVTGPVSNIFGSSRSFQESNIDLASVSNLTIYQNISGLYTFFPGTSTRLFEFQPVFYNQPFTTTNYVTQFLNLNQPGWKFLKYAKVEAIGASPITLTINSQDGGIKQYLLNNPVTQSVYLGQLETWLSSQKARMYSFGLSSATPFVPFGLHIRMKHWGGVEFEEINVMGNNI